MQQTEVGGQRQSDARSETTEQASGIAGVNAWDGNVLGNNRTGSYHHVIADRNREDGGIGSDTHMIAKLGGAPKFWFPGRTAVTEQVVNEHGAVRNETVVPDGDELANERVGLNPAPLTDGCSFLNFNERSDEGVIADVAAV